MFVLIELVSKNGLSEAQEMMATGSSTYTFCLYPCRGWLFRAKNCVDVGSGVMPEYETRIVREDCSARNYESRWEPAQSYNAGA